MVDVTKVRIFYDDKREVYGIELGGYERDEAMIILGYLEMAKAQIVGHYTKEIGDQVKP